jgi:vacuolar-type H+-ATPase subunit E/Vma4
MIQQSPVKTERFLDAINKAAMDKCKDINNKINQMMEKELQEAQERIDKKNHKKIDREVAKVCAQSKMDVANYHSDHKNAIYKKRLGYEKEIFSEARSAIVNFVNSDNYADFIINHTKEIAQLSSGQCEVYMRPVDCEKYGAQVQEILGNCTLHQDKSIELGGIKVKSFEKGLLYDNTLDSRFEQQKEWFYNNCPLNIEII